MAMARQPLSTTTTVRRFVCRRTESNAPVKVSNSHHSLWVEEICTEHQHSPLTGGWDPKTNAIPQDLNEQIDQAFANVDLTLKTAGVKDGWKQVFSVKSYHVVSIGEKTIEAMVRNLRKWMPDHRPIWTMLGVPTLALEDMKVEIDVVAIDE